MVRLTTIALALLGLFLGIDLGYTDEKSNFIEPSVYHKDHTLTEANRPLSILMVDVDEEIHGVEREKTVRNQGEKPMPTVEKKRNVEKGQKKRSIPPKATAPSEAIKADQEVDFPYDI